MKAKTRLGKDRTLNEAKLFSLLTALKSTRNSAKFIEIRNEIAVELTPAVETTTFSFQGQVNIDDLKQDCFEDLLRSIPKWNPSKAGTIGGFFRRVIRNHCLDFLKDEDRKPKLVSLDSLDYEQLQGPELNLIESIRPPVLFEGSEQEAFTAAINWLPNIQHENRGFGHLQRLLCDTYSISMRRAKLIIDHAKVSFREFFMDQVSTFDVDQYRDALPTDSLFRRLLAMLDSGSSLHDVIKLFGGLQIRIPNAYTSTGGDKNDE